MSGKKTGLSFLYNALYAISSNYDELKGLESSIFEVMDEIDSCIATGFNQQALTNYLKSGMGDELVNEIEEFGRYVSGIENEHWNSNDFDNYEDWRLARNWAKSLMKKLDMPNKGWDFGSSRTIYTGKGKD